MSNQNFKHDLGVRENQAMFEIFEFFEMFEIQTMRKRRGRQAWRSDSKGRIGLGVRWGESDVRT